ncbi:MAG: hypothetical protein ACOC8M_03105 [Guyparkeria sp.]
MSSSEQERSQLQETFDRTKKAAEKLGANDKQARRAAATGAQLRRQFSAELTLGILATVAIAVITFLLGDFIGVGTSVLLFGGLLGGAFVVNRLGGFSVPFGISVFVVAVVLAEFLPAWITEPFAVVVFTFESLTGWPVRQFGDPTEFAVIGMGVIVLIWFVDIRFTSGLRKKSGQPDGVKPGTIAKQLQERATGFFETWLEVAVAFLFLAFAIAQAAAFAGADLGELIFNELAQAPVISAALGTDLIAFKALGGSIPVLDELPIVGPILEFLGSIGPAGFAAIAVFLLALAVFARRNK